MQKIKCEMCGSGDFLKQDGVFVCQNCGCKYTLEEAKKMMVEIQGIVNVSGTIKVDKNEEVSNLLARAKQFEQEGLDKKAIEYYNKILDIDANNELAKEKIKQLSFIYIGNVKVPSSTLKQIENFVSTHQKIEAIKLVRSITGFSLSEAKMWVENYSTFDIKKEQNIKNISSTLNKQDTSSGGCYVATCVYGSYDCPEVWTLRRYRDQTLGATRRGRAFIKLYYAISPKLVKMFGKTKWFKKMWKGKLDRMVKKLNDNGVENTPYQDKNWN